MKPPRWMSQATGASDGEVERVLRARPEAWAPALARASSATDGEVAAVIASAGAPAPRGARSWAVPLGAALLLATVALLALAVPRGGEEIAAPAFVATGDGPWREEPAPGSSHRIVQADGVVRYEVSPMAPGETFTVRAGPLEVSVVGTQFEVGLDGKAAWVEVFEGRVAVRDGALSLVLAPGERFDHPLPVAAAPEPVAVPAPAVPVPVAPPVAPSPAAAPAAPPEPVPTAPEPAPTSVYAALLARLEGGEVTAELAAELEAFAEARSGSLLAQEAAIAAIEVRSRIEPPARAVARIEAFLSEHDAGPHRWVLLDRELELLRGPLGDCGAALGVADALARGSAAHRGRALAARGLCELALGRPAEARGTLPRALAAGLEDPLASEVRVAIDALGPVE